LWFILKISLSAIYQNEIIMEKAKVFIILIPVLLLLASCGSKDKPGTMKNGMYSISLNDLKDKIKGGWTGQTIGCTFGGPTEFKFKGTMIQD